MAVFLFGIFTAPLVYFGTLFASQAEAAAHGWTLPIENLGFTAAIAAMFTFILPSAALFVFLVLTEKDRGKPWAK